MKENRIEIQSNKVLVDHCARLADVYSPVTLSSVLSSLNIGELLRRYVGVGFMSPISRHSLSRRLVMVISEMVSYFSSFELYVEEAEKYTSIVFGLWFIDSQFSKGYWSNEGEVNVYRISPRESLIGFVEGSFN